MADKQQRITELEQKLFGVSARLGIEHTKYTTLHDAVEKYLQLRFKHCDDETEVIDQRMVLHELVDIDYWTGKPKEDSDA